MSEEKTPKSSDKEGSQKPQRAKMARQASEQSARSKIAINRQEAESRQHRDTTAIDKATATSRNWLARLGMFFVFGVILTGLLLFNLQNPEINYPPAPDDAPAEPNQIIVHFHNEVDLEQIEQIGQSFGLDFIVKDDPLKQLHIYLAHCPPDKRTAIIEALRQHEWVKHAEPNHIYEFYFTPNDKDYSKQWHLAMIDVETAWDYTQGQGALVAVVDSGVRSNDKAGNSKVRDLDSTQFLDGYDFVDDDPVAQDSRARISGHGTHVAGTIAQATHNNIMGAGVAFRATVLPVRVLNDRGRGRAYDVANGIIFASNQGADVINLSLGSFYLNKAIRKAVTYAYNNGAVLVAAAGNDAKPIVGYPAKFAETIAVSAVGPDGILAPYSNRGQEIDISAPGGNLRKGKAAGIWQNVVYRGKDTFHPLHGTSMAAPHVAGVAALLVSLGVEGDPEKIRNILQKTAQPKGDQEKYGAGLLNAAAAVQALAPMPNPKPALGKGLLSRLTAWIPLHLAPVFSLLCFAFASRRSAHENQLLQRVLEITLVFAAGIFLPTLIERLFGTGSDLNIIGHSILIPAILAYSTALSHRFRDYLALFTAGLMFHLMADLGTRQDPFAFSAAGAAQLFLTLNIVAAAIFIVLFIQRQ